MFRRLIRFKVYFDASKAYWGYASFFMIVMVFLEAYKETKFGIWFFSKWWTIPAFIVLFIICAVVFGYIILKYIKPTEMSTVNKRNPEFMEMYNKIMKDKE